MYLSCVLIVDTASGLLLWSKGKHVLVSGVLYCTLELDIKTIWGEGGKTCITGSVWLIISVIVLSIGSCSINSCLLKT